MPFSSYESRENRRSESDALLRSINVLQSELRTSVARFGRRLVSDIWREGRSVKPCDILNVKNGLLKSVHCGTEYKTACGIATGTVWQPLLHSEWPNAGLLLQSVRDIATGSVCQPLLHSEWPKAGLGLKVTDRARSV